jgi:hypothetical protein
MGPGTVLFTRPLVSYYRFQLIQGVQGEGSGTAVPDGEITERALRTRWSGFSLILGLVHTKFRQSKAKSSFQRTAALEAGQN